MAEIPEYRTIDIPALVRSRGKYYPNRLSATLFGRQIFFESKEELAARPEALCSAFLFQSMARGYHMRVDSPVCPNWLSHLTDIQAIASDWWGYEPISVSAPSAPVKPVSDKVALFFTGGVDSFFSLIQERDRLSTLVYVEGYDVSLRDERRLALIRRANREIADAFGMGLIHLRSNLRRHPFFKSLSWGQIYGEAIVSVGFLLSGHAREFLFASGAPRWRDFPRGNHGKLDPLWSSDDVAFTHHGDEYDRPDKVEGIKENPIARRHLRVCWKNQPGRMNCGICEKCLRTELMLLSHGVLDAFETFPKVDIKAAVANLPGLESKNRPFFEQVIPQLPDLELREEVRRLVTRELPNHALHDNLSKLRRTISRLSKFRI